MSGPRSSNESNGDVLFYNNCKTNIYSLYLNKFNTKKTVSDIFNYYYHKSTKTQKLKTMYTWITRIILLVKPYGNQFGRFWIYHIQTDGLQFIICQSLVYGAVSAVRPFRTLFRWQSILLKLHTLLAQYCEWVFIVYSWNLYIDWWQSNIVITK